MKFTEVLCHRRGKKWVRSEGKGLQLTQTPKQNLLSFWSSQEKVSGTSAEEKGVSDRAMHPGTGPHPSVFGSTHSFQDLRVHPRCNTAPPVPSMPIQAQFTPLWLIKIADLSQCMNRTASKLNSTLLIWEFWVHSRNEGCWVAASGFLGIACY